ncbi:MAG: ABC transporter permease subunit [Magnetococcales bacterium]|nr:ABC transporter permease subunit [Magnetococcales bacterium]
MAQSGVFVPAAGDFQPDPAPAVTVVTATPACSFWRDVWRQLRGNPQAIASLCVIIGLLAFTLLGPWLWPLDPDAMDLDRISRPPAWPEQAQVVPALSAGSGPELVAAVVMVGSPQGADTLAAPQNLALAGIATTLEVRLTWSPVAGSAGYRVYRHPYPPSGPADLGVPLGEVTGGDRVGFVDRLRLEPIPYHYSVVATDGVDAAPRFATRIVQPVPAITLEAAQKLRPNVQVGETITLPFHPLGLDYLGRDLLARLLLGARTSLFIGIIAPLCSVLLGALYGGIAGYQGGWLDEWLMRFADFVVALPFLLFMILLRIAFGITSGESGIVPMLIAMILLGWPGAARLVRGQVMQLREQGFVQAARLFGGGGGYILWRHLLPNVLGVILVTLTFAVPSAIFTEAFLSFIGMGVVPPTPSWGSLCQQGVKGMLNHPHELLFPALCISATVLAFNLFGDGLRDALDTRGERRA